MLMEPAARTIPGLNGNGAGAHIIPRISFGLFLGVSWTWCIGMYLPVLLVRDLGIWGWVIFAVPNVVGAAAMGWVLTGPAASTEMLHEHREACVWFSIVTVAFHVFFVGWMIRALIGPAGVVLAALATAGTWGMSLWRRDGGQWCAAAVFVLSLVLSILLLASGDLSLPSLSMQADSANELAALIPVCLLGFCLCPYLDLTFHAARQQTTPADGRWAFGLGFGLFFLLMIVFTLGYAAPLAAGIGGILALCVGIHMAVQSGFTIGAHLREVLSVESRQVHQAVAMGLLILAATILAGTTREGIWMGMRRGELVYLAFMGFYALIFPAYVWICMTGRGGRPTPDSRGAVHRRRMMFVFAVLTTSPMFALAFVGRQWAWLWPGVAVVVLARYAGRRRMAQPHATEYVQSRDPTGRDS